MEMGPDLPVNTDRHRRGFGRAARPVSVVRWTARKQPTPPTPSLLTYLRNTASIGGPSAPRLLSLQRG